MMGPAGDGSTLGPAFDGFLFGAIGTGEHTCSHSLEPNWCHRSSRRGHAHMNNRFCCLIGFELLDRSNVSLAVVRRLYGPKLLRIWSGIVPKRRHRKLSPQLS